MGKNSSSTAMALVEIIFQSNKVGAGELIFKLALEASEKNLHAETIIGIVKEYFNGSFSEVIDQVLPYVNPKMMADISSVGYLDQHKALAAIMHAWNRKIEDDEASAMQLCILNRVELSTHDLRAAVVLYDLMNSGPCKEYVSCFLRQIVFRSSVDSRWNFYQGLIDDGCAMHLRARTTSSRISIFTGAVSNAI